MLLFSSGYACYQPVDNLSLPLTIRTAIIATLDMTNPPPLHIRLREARRARGMSQHALAETVGCKQPAVSMMERGQGDALSREKLVAIAETLAVRLEDADLATARATGATVWKVCPVADCPSNVPYTVAGQLLFLPQPVRAPLATPSRCVFCGEVLMDACAHCGAPIHPGACCASCGGTYVPVNGEGAPDVEGWAVRQREQVFQIRSLMSP